MSQIGALRHWSEHLPTVEEMRSVLILWGGMLFGGVLGFGAEVLFARHLPLQAYGNLATAMTLLTVASPIVGAGAGHFLLRRWGEEGQTARRWLAPTLRVVCILAALVGTAIAAWTLTAGLEPEARGVLVILLPTLLYFAVAEAAHGVFQIEERFGSLAVLHTLPFAMRVLVGFLALGLGLTLMEIAVGLSASLVLLALLFLIVLRRRLPYGESADGEPSWNDSYAAASPRAVLRGTWPYGLSGLLILLHARADVVLVGWLAGGSAAGILQVAIAILAVIHYLPTAVFGKYLLPRYHRMAIHERAELKRVHRYWTRRVAVVGLGMGILTALAAPLFVPFLFGSEYAASVPLLVLLSPAIPLRFAAAGHEALLGTGNWIRPRLRVQAMGSVVHIAGTLALLPTVGLYAPVISTLAAEALLFGLYAQTVRRSLDEMPPLLARESTQAAGPLGRQS